MNEYETVKKLKSPVFEQKSVGWMVIATASLFGEVETILLFKEFCDLIENKYVAEVDLL